MTSETVSYPANRDTIDGFIAVPKDGAKHPGVILVQEVWGVEAHIKDLVQQLANEGFIVLAPDLYHGRVFTEPDEARKEGMARGIDGAISEIQQAISYLQGRDDVEPKAIAMAGFCMGGFLTWKVAEVANAQLACIAPFYGGRYDPSPEEIARITVPILAIYGEEDKGIPPEKIKKTEDLLEQQGKDYRIIVYPNSGHAFMNPDHGHGNPEAAADAFAELVAFLKNNLD